MNPKQSFKNTIIYQSKGERERERERERVTNYIKNKMRIKRVKNTIFIMQQDGIYEIKEKKITI